MRLVSGRRNDHHQNNNNKDNQVGDRNNDAGGGDDDTGLDDILNDMNIDDDYNLLFSSIEATNNSDSNNNISSKSFNTINYDSEVLTQTQKSPTSPPSITMNERYDEDDEEVNDGNTDENDDMTNDTIEVMIQTSPIPSLKKNRSKLSQVFSFRKPHQNTITTSAANATTSTCTTTVLVEDSTTPSTTITTIKSTTNNKTLEDGIAVSQEPHTAYDFLPTPIASSTIESHYFSKHYILSSNDQEQILQLQYEVFGTKESLLWKKKASTPFISSLFGTTTHSEMVKWNTQLDLWNQIMIPPNNTNNTTIPISSTSDASSKCAISPLSERSSSIVNTNSTINSRSIILWRSNRSIPIYVAADINNNNNNEHSNNNTHQCPCTMILWTTGIMIQTIPAFQDDDKVYDNDTTTKTLFPEPPLFNLQTVLQWMNCEYIDVFTSNISNNKASTSKSTRATNSAPCKQHFEILNDDNENTNDDIKSVNKATPTQYSYGISCHFSSSHDDNSKSNIKEKTTTSTKPTKSKILILFVTQHHRDIVYKLMTNVMIQYHTYHPGPGMSHLHSHGPQLDVKDDPPQPHQSLLGWQYHFYYEPHFTMAVTNMLDDDNQRNHNDIHQPMTNNINRIDTYNGMTPLHYAVYYNHVPAIVQLIETNRRRGYSSTMKNPIDMNILDENHSWTPLDYCIMYQLPTSTMDLLKQHGATKITVATVVDAKQFHYEMKGELFGKVKATEEIIDERRHRQHRQAEMIQEQKEQNHNLLFQMQQRGEQINTLSQGAMQLQQNANEFASMAKQLKERTKCQHDKYYTWFPFVG